MRVFSGIQPSGTLHLGNYFGSMHPNKELAKSPEQSLYCIVDLHALTSVHDPVELRRFRADAALDCLVCGFTPDCCTLFFQSDVAEHSELSWIISTVAPTGLLERAVSYKEKVEKGVAASVGLFTYPVLMAADILLYDTDVVPVGRDQKQHLEITRDIAMKFNAAFGDTFVVPEPKIREEVAVVPGIDGQKMSKSYGNTIPLFAPEKQIEKAIMSIVTDSKGARDPKDPDTCVIFQIHKLFLNNEEQKALADEYKQGLPYGDAKKKLLATYLAFFRPMRERRSMLEADPKAVAGILADGAARARVTAGKTMERVRKAVGLR